MASVPRPRRAVVALLVTALVAALAAVAAGALRPWAAPVAEVEQASAQKAVITPAAVGLPEHPRVLVVGDSWTFGMAATPIESGYAYVLADLIDGTTVVDGVPGSGYIRPDRPVFRDRIAALDTSVRYDLIVLQGSINDRRAYERATYRQAVTAAWDRLATAFPDTPVVVLGPAPQVLPVERATAAIDRDLASLAADRQWWYVSPIQEEWITEDNYRTVIDTSETGRDHPSVAGHAYLAERLADALSRITDPATTVEASDEEATAPDSRTLR